MKRALIILLSILLVFSVSAQKKKRKEPERQPDQIDLFLQRIDTTHELEISAMNRVINYGYQRFIAHAEWMIGKSETREDMAYWEWFAGYLQITSRRDMEGGFVHVEKALNLTRDSGIFRCKMLELEVKYYDHTQEYKKELLTLDEINRVTVKLNGKSAFWACMKKAQLLQYLNHPDEASAAFSKAIETGSSDSTALAEAYYNRAIIRLKSMRSCAEANARHIKMLKDSTIAVNDSVRVLKDSATIANDSSKLMAIVAKLKNDSTNILKDIETAMDMDGNQVRYIYEHARLCNQWYDTMPEYRAMIENDCRRILKLDTMPTLSSVRHCALALLDMKFEAERWIDKVVANFGDNEHNWVYIYYNKAYIYALQKDVEGAMENLDEAERHGGISCSKLENDANFYNLWGTDEFEELKLRVCME